MKNKSFIGLCAMLLCFSVCNAQVTQADLYITATYLGYTANGEYMIQVNNKQADCMPELNITWNGVTITALSPNNTGSMNYVSMTSNTQTFYLKGSLMPNPIFSIKALTVCDWMGLNPVEVEIGTSPTALPITLEYFRDSISSLGIMFQWKSSIESNTKDYRLQFQNSDTSWSDIKTMVANNKPSTYSCFLDSFTYHNSKISIVMVLMMVQVVLGMLFGFKRNLKVITSFFMVGVVCCTISCTKSKERAVNSILKGNYRLAIDHDGTTDYTKVLHI